MTSSMHQTCAVRSHTLTALATLAALLAAASVTGCATGELTVDVLVMEELHSLRYHLEPAGRLTVTPGGGMVEGQSDQPVFTTQLDAPAMARFKRVVARSGFLLADAPRPGLLARGPALRMEVKLGLWHNVVHIVGGRQESAVKIVRELNRHLPVKYQLDYDPAPAGEGGAKAGDPFGW